MYVDIKKINWKKINNMLPVIIQHYISGIVLMHGYMNQEAFKISQKTKLLTLFSRTKNRLWTKGEISKNFLYITDIIIDCDQDAMLILVHPKGNTCHLNNISCFNGVNPSYSFLYTLENVIFSRKMYPLQESYISSMYLSGLPRLAQKVGEESIETIIAALEKKSNNLIDEASDLLFHFLVLLNGSNLNLHDIILNLIKRFK